MAPRQTLESHPKALEGTPFLYRLHSIVGTGGLKTAGRREQRRDDPLINTDRKNEQRFKKLTHFSVEFRLLRAVLAGG